MKLLSDLFVLEMDVDVVDNGNEIKGPGTRNVWLWIFVVIIIVFLVILIVAAALRKPVGKKTEGQSCADSKECESGFRCANTCIGSGNPPGSKCFTNRVCCANFQLDASGNYQYISAGVTGALAGTVVAGAACTTDTDCNQGLRCIHATQNGTNLVCCATATVINGVVVRGN